MAKWEAGQSGNPAGRPKKNRAWTAILERAGSKKIDTPDGKRTRKQVLAELVMQAITTGRVDFPNGESMELSPRDWQDMLWKAYGQVDGPPRLDVDVTTDGEKIIAPQVFLPPIAPEPDE